MNALPEKKFISTKEASDLSGYNPDHLARLARDGEVDAVRVGRTWHIERESLEFFLKKQGRRVKGFAGLISAKDASKKYGYSADYLARLARSGEVKGSLVGRTWLVDRESLDSFFKIQDERKGARARELARARAQEYRGASHRPAKTPGDTEFAKPTLRSAPRPPEVRRGFQSRRFGRLPDRQRRVGVFKANASVFSTFENPIAKGASGFLDFKKILRSEAFALAVALLVVGGASLVAQSGTIAGLAAESGALAHELSIGFSAAFGDIPARIAARANEVAVMVHSRPTLESTNLEFAIFKADVHSNRQFAVQSPVSARQIADAWVRAVHAVINADVSLAYGVAEAAPAIARGVFDAEYRVALSLTRLLDRVEQEYLALIEDASSIAYDGGQRIFKADASVGSPTIEDASGFSNLASLVRNAYLGALGKLAAAWESQTFPNLNNAMLSVTQHPQLAAALSPAEELALATYETLNGWFSSASRTLASLFAPTSAPTATGSLTSNAVPRSQTSPVAVATSTPPITTASPKTPTFTAPKPATIVAGPSYPTYVTNLNGVSVADVKQLLATERSTILATVSGMIQPVAAQGVTNMTTIQQVNMIEDLTDLIVRNGDFRGGTFTGGSLSDGIYVGATTGVFGNLTAGATSLTGDLLTVGGITSYASATAPYFVATSTSATSTFSGGISIARQPGVTGNGAGGLYVRASDGYIGNSPNPVVPIDFSNTNLDYSAPTQVLFADSIVEGRGLTDISSMATVSVSSGVLVAGGPTFRNANSRWESGGVGSSLTLDLGGSHPIIGITFGGWYKTGCTVGAVAIDGSNDNSNWTSMGTPSGGSATTCYQISLFAKGNYNGPTLGTYRYVRITVTNAGVSPQIAGLQVLSQNYAALWGTSVWGVNRSANDIYLRMAGGGGANGFGRLGIGTSTLYSKLTVWDDQGTGTGQAFEVVNSASTTLMRVLDNGTTYLSGTLGIGTTSPDATLSILQTANGTPIISAYRITDTAPSGDFISYKQQDGTPLFRVDNSGNLLAGGIINSGSQTITSASTPQFRLQYDPTNELTFSTNSTGTTTLAINGTAPGLVFTPQSNLVNTFNFTDAASDSVLSIDTVNKRVGIGTASPQAKLDVQGIASSTTFYANNGTVSAPAYSFSSATNSGLLNSGAGLIDVAINGTSQYRFASNAFTLPSSNIVGWTNGNTSQGPDVNISRLSAGVLSVNTSNSTNNALGTLIAGNVGVGSTTPWGQLSVNPNGITGPAFVIGSSTATNFIVTNGGNVGIGTTSPSSKLYVLGASAISNNQTGASAGLSLSLFTNDGSSHGIRILPRATVGSYNPIVQTDDSSIIFSQGAVDTGGLVLAPWSASVKGIRITNDGNVGIGTTSPVAKLQVSGASGEIRVDNTNTNGTAIWSTYDTDGNFHTRLLAGGSAWAPVSYPDYVAGDAILHNAKGKLAFTADATNTYGYQMVLTTTGNVGVGSTTPWGQLSVNPNGIAGPAFVVGSSTATNFIVTNAGNVGIGTVSPTSRLFVQDNLNTVLTLQSYGTSGTWGSESILFHDNNGNTDTDTAKILATKIGGLTFSTYGTSLKARWTIDAQGDLVQSEDSSLDRQGIIFNANTSYGKTKYISVGQTGATGYHGDVLEISAGAGNGVGNTNGGDVRIFGGSPNDSGSYGNVILGYNGTSAVGNVGIGLTNPNANLSVKTATTDGTIITGMRIFNSGSGANTGTRLSLGYADNDAAAASIVGYYDGNSPSNLGFGIETAGTRRLTIKGDGNVGIGTTSPVTALTIQTVNYSALISLSNTFSNNGREYRIGSLTAGSQIGAEGSFGIYDATNATTRLLIAKDTGNVGIGSTTPWGQLSVNPNGITGPAFVVGSSTATNFIVTNAGNVGIGTSSPTSKLSIQGVGTTSANSILNLMDSTGASKFFVRNDGNIYVTPSGTYSTTVTTSSFNISPTITNINAGNNTTLNVVNINPAVVADAGFIPSSSRFVSIAPSLTSNVAWGDFGQSGSLAIPVLSVGTSFSSLRNVGMDMVRVDATVNNYSSYFINGFVNRITVGAPSVAAGNYVRGFYSQFAISSGVSVTSNAPLINFGVDSYSGSGTANTQIGYYVGSLTGATYNTGLYFANTPNSGSIASAGSTHIAIMPGSGGNVGIGTTSPSTFKLQVQGNIGPDKDVTYDLGSTALRFKDLYAQGGIFKSSAGSAIVSIDNVGGGNYSYLLFKEAGNNEWAIRNSAGADGFLGFYDYNGTAGVRMVIQESTGNVGIGTTSPGNFRSLEVYRSGATAVIGVDQAGSTQYAGYAVNRGGVEKWFTGINNIDDQFRIRRNATSDDFVINASGNIGVGTSTVTSNLPDESKFIVVGGAITPAYVLKSTLTAQESRVITAGNGLFLDVAGSATVTDNSIIFRTGRTAASYTLTEAMRIDNQGNVGVGSTTPWGQLSVNPNGITGPAFVVGSSTATNFIVTNGGKVGIGTASPGTKLQIVGPADGIQILAADFASDGSNTNKDFVLAVPHQTDSEEAFGVLLARSDASENNVFIGGSAPPTNALWNAATAIRFYTAASRTTVAGTERMMIQSDGNVGVGSTTPWGQLSVNPNGITGPAFVVGSSTATNFIVTNGGNVGIGTTSPQNPFSIQGTGPQLSLYTNSSPYGYTIGRDIGTGFLNILGNQVGYTGVNIGYSGNSRVSISPDSGGQIFGYNSTESYPRFGIGGSLSGSSGSGVNFNYGGSVPATSNGSAIGMSTNPRTIGFWTSNGSSFVERMTIDSTGNVGIGTTSPYSMLSVQATAGGTTPLFVIASSTNGAATSTALFVASNGYVGIGTASPSAKLQVTTETRLGTTFSGDVGSASPAPLLRFDNQYDDTGNRTANKIVLYDNGAYRSGFGVSNGQTDFFSGAGLSFFINHVSEASPGTEAVTVKTTGNVGIGTTTPVSRLNILGPDNLSATDYLQEMAPSLTEGIGFGYQNIRKIGSSANSNLVIDAKGTGNLLLQTVATGNVGIGTTTPTRKLEVDGVVGVYDTTKNLNMGVASEVGAMILNFGGNDDSSNRFGGSYTSASSGGFLRLDTRGEPSYPLFGFFGRAAGSTSIVSQLMSITSAGTVGIGTANPGAKLDVIADDANATTLASVLRIGHSLSSGSPVGTDTLPTQLEFLGERTNGSVTQQAAIQSRWTDATNGAEDGDLLFRTILNSSYNDAVLIKSTGDVTPGADNTQDFGSSSLHWDCLYYDATALGTCASDARFKGNIADLALGEDPLAQVMGLRARTFTYNSDPAQTVNYGFVAQEVLEVAPELVATGADGFYEVKYGYLPYLTLAAVQELGAKFAVPAEMLGATSSPSAVLTADGEGIDLYRLATYATSNVAALAERLDAQETRLTSLEERLAALESGAVSMATSSPLSFSSSTLASALESMSGVLNIKQLVSDTFYAARSFVDHLFAANATIGSSTAPAGVTLYDTVTKEPYCFSIAGGAPTTTPGVCVDSVESINPFATSSPISNSQFLISNEDTSTTGNAPLAITLAGATPTYVAVGGTYIEEGAIVTGGSGGAAYTMYVDGYAIDSLTPALDTSTPTTHILTYQATDGAGNMVVAYRSVIVEEGAAEQTTVTEPAPATDTTTTDVATSTEPVVVEEAAPVVDTATTTEPAI